MQLEIRLDPELKVLLERLIEALRDLAVVTAPLTGYRVIADEEE